MLLPYKNGYWIVERKGKREVVEVDLEKDSYRPFGNGARIGLTDDGDENWIEPVETGVNKPCKKEGWPGKYPDKEGSFLFKKLGGVHVVKVKKFSNKQFIFFFCGEGWDIKSYSDPQDWGPEIDLEQWND